MHIYIYIYHLVMCLYTYVCIYICIYIREREICCLPPAPEARPKGCPLKGRLGGASDF